MREFISQKTASRTWNGLHTHKDTKEIEDELKEDKSLLPVFWQHPVKRQQGNSFIATVWMVTGT